jgi:hypothetical protein
VAASTSRLTTCGSLAGDNPWSLAKSKHPGAKRRKVDAEARAVAQQATYDEGGADFEEHGELPTASPLAPSLPAFPQHEINDMDLRQDDSNSTTPHSNQPTPTGLTSLHSSPHSTPQ